MKISVKLLMFIVMVGLAQQEKISDYEEIIKRIQIASNSNRLETVNLLGAIYEFKKQLEIRINQIADPDISVSVRKGICDRTIAEFFENEHAKVQVNNKYRDEVSTKDVWEYFDGLMRMKEMYGYSKVEYIFEKVTVLLDIKPLEGDIYQVAISFWQTFKGKNDVGTLYDDATRKKVLLLVRKNKDGRWNIMAKEITVSERAINLEEYWKLPK